MTDLSNFPTPESTANFDLDSRCFSEVMTSNADYTTTRASDGNVKKTFAAALREAGQEHVGEWSTNPEVTSSNQVIPYAGTNQLFRPLSLPYQVDSATNPNPNTLLPDPSTGYAGELVDVSKFTNEEDIYESAGYPWVQGETSVKDRIYNYQPASGPAIKFYDPVGGNVLGNEPDSNFAPVVPDYNSIHAAAFGIKLNSDENQSAALLAAITECANAGKFLFIPEDSFVKGNVSTEGINVRISGKGTIKPFVKTSPAAFFKGGFDDAFAVTGVQTVTEVVTPLHGDATLTKLTVPGHNYSTGDRVKVVSEDLIPSCLVSDGTRNGEWASVYSVDGSSVYLNRVLDEAYTTTIRVARIKDLTCELYVKFDGEETATAAKQLISIVAFNEPKGTLRLENNGGAGCYMVSNYAPEFTYTAKNLADEPANGKYGYGMDDIGNCFAKFYNVFGDTCRHVYTTGKAGSNSEIENYGEPYKSQIVNGIAVNCTSTAWDTHSQGNDIKFIGLKADGNRASYVARCKGVEWVTCNYGDTNVGFRVLNVTDQDFASGRLTNCTGKGDADIPISVTSQGGGRSSLVVDGGEFNFRLVTSPLQFNKGEVSFVNEPRFVTKDTSTNFSIAQIVDTNFETDGGEIDLSTVDMGTRGVFQLNGETSFKSSSEINVPVKSSNGDLFMTSDSGNTASISAYIKTNSFNKARQIDGINGDIEIQIVDDEVEQNATGYQSVAIGATDPIDYFKPLDGNVYLRIATAGGGSTPSSIVDGAFPGQQCCYHNLTGGVLTIPDSLSNILVGSVIQVGEAKIATWQPAGWVFS